MVGYVNEGKCVSRPSFWRESDFPRIVGGGGGRGLGVYEMYCTVCACLCR